MTENHGEFTEWLGDALNGDQAALAKLFESQRDRMTRMIHLRMDHRLRGRIDPSDVLQDTFLDVSRRLPSYAAIRAELRQRVQAALAAMEPLDREILALRHYELLSNVDAASVLRLTKSAASNRYIRALRRLKDFLGEDDWDQIQ